MDNSRYQVMVFAMSASLQTGDGNLPVLRRRPLILGFLFVSHGVPQNLRMLRSLHVSLDGKIPKPNI
jgi:hypothetical protein